MSSGTVPCAGGPLHTVEAGETLWGLARRYLVSVEALRLANPQITDPNVLAVGQVICIPPGTAPGACPAGATTYTVKAGDTLYAIAQRYGTTVAELERLNPGVDPMSLQVARILCVPGPATRRCPGVSYVVQPGDTYTALAARHGVTVEALRAANPAINPNNIPIGAVICIPVQR